MGAGTGRRIAVAVDVGGTKILAGLVGPRGEVPESRTVPADPLGGEQVLAQVVELVRSLRRAAPAGATITGLGVSVPGAVRADGTVWAPNLPGWRRVSLGAHLTRTTGLRAVVRDDRLTSLLGEVWLGAARNVRSAAFLTIGTGIGLGFMTEGHFWTGAHGAAGSVGWWARGRTDAAAAASRVGALESAVAGPAILRRMRQSRIPGASVQDLVSEARRGNRRAQALIDDTARLIGVTVADVVSMLDPDVVIVGGGVMQPGRFPLAPLRAAIRTYAQPLARQVPIRRSALGARASFLGAAALVHRARGHGRA